MKRNGSGLRRAVLLTADEIALLLECIDSERYHRSPEALRNSGFVLEPHPNDDAQHFVDDDEGGTPWAEYAQELDKLAAALRGAK